MRVDWGFTVSFVKDILDILDATKWEGSLNESQAVALGFKGSVFSLEALEPARSYTEHVEGLIREILTDRTLLNIQAEQGTLDAMWLHVAKPVFDPGAPYSWYPYAGGYLNRVRFILWEFQPSSFSYVVGINIDTHELFSGSINWNDVNSVEKSL